MWINSGTEFNRKTVAAARGFLLCFSHADRTQKASISTQARERAMALCFRLFWLANLAIRGEVTCRRWPIVRRMLRIAVAENSAASERRTKVSRVNGMTLAIRARQLPDKS